AARQPRKARAQGKLRAERRLHVAVARAGDAAGVERELYEPRAVDAEAGFPAPEIGHAEERLGNGDEIRRAAAERGQMPARHEAAVIEPGEGGAQLADADSRVEADGHARRRLDVARRIDEGGE